VQAVHGLDLEAHDGVDLKGDMYEYLLSRLSMSGTNGQFRTPRHIIALIVALVDPKPGLRVCDPAAGTAGFLIAAYNHILTKHTSKGDLARGQVTGNRLSPAQWKFLEEQAFTGYDNDANMVKIAILNLYLHRLEKAHVEFHNPLTTGKGAGYPGLTFDVILANPPFAGKVQAESILSDLNHGLNTRATELLFLKWFLDHLAPGGRAGVIVPNGVLFGSTNAARKVRELLLTECDLQAVINLPSGVFKPYSGVGTAALIFEKPAAARLAAVRRTAGDPAAAATQSVWFYDLTADGFTLSDTRTPIEENDIPDVLAKWPAREEGPKSFRVPMHEIAAHDHILLPSRYRPQIVAPVDHDPPQRVLDDVLRLEAKIVEKAADLRKLIHS
jgi:type I restriction enzyme M protein